MTTVWGKDMYVDLPKWMKIVKIFEFHVNTHQRVTSAEENFNNQVHRETCSADTSQPPFPVTAVVFQCVRERSGRGGRDGGCAWAQQQDPAIATTECPVCQQQRTTVNPRCGPIPQGDRPATWWQVDGYKLLPSWKGSTLFLLK